MIMRLLFSSIVIILLLSTAVAAYSTTILDVPGSEPAVSGNTIAFLIFEDAIDKDLNRDDDVSDHVIQYYFLGEDKIKNTGEASKHFGLSGNSMAIEDNARKIFFYDFANDSLTDTKTRGAMPSVLGKIISFATAENDVVTDLNEDYDTSDTIIQYYDKSSNTTTSTKAIGTNPALIDDRIIFETREDALDEDLNNDGDTTDTIIRVFDIKTKKITNTKITGTNPFVWKNDVVVTDENEFAVIDLNENAKTPTNVFGNHPVLYNDILLYEKNEMLYYYRISTGVEQQLNILGKEPALGDDIITFVNENKTITILEGKDPDKDHVPDFFDNCPVQSNTDQLDDDKDGIGNACDAISNAQTENTSVTNTTSSQINQTATNQTSQQIAQTSQQSITAKATAEPQQKIPAERNELPEPVVLHKEKKSKNKTSWFLIAVGLIALSIIAYMSFIKWQNKRKKSYGF